MNAIANGNKNHMLQKFKIIQVHSVEEKVMAAGHYT
jgi:hypothetical protein